MAAAATATEKPPVLITLPLSLFNELGRWSLESCGVGYEERRHTPVLHVLASRLRGGGGTTPLLLAGGHRIDGSAAIAEWADSIAPDSAHIYPRDRDARNEAEAFVAHVADDLGVHARRMAWEFFVDDPEAVMRFWSEGTPSWEQRITPTMLRVSKPAVRRKMDLSEETLAEAPAKTFAAFDEIAERLGDGRQFLGGDRFGIHDIAFATMASPAVCPTDGYPVPHFQPEDFPEVHADRIRRFREHPAGRFALRMYAEHRSPATPGSY